MATRMKEKAAKRLEEDDKRPTAKATYVRMSPFKVRAVLNIVRGAPYADAVAILNSTSRAAALPVRKLIESAGANAENNLNMSKNDLFIAEIFADEGPTLKRMWPRSHGSADRINKRTSHITVILDEVKKESKVKTAKAVKNEKRAKGGAK